MVETTSSCNEANEAETFFVLFCNSCSIFNIENSVSLRIFSKLAFVSLTSVDIDDCIAFDTDCICDPICVNVDIVCRLSPSTCCIIC